jgi:hypothetical protein
VSSGDGLLMNDTDPDADNLIVNEVNGNPSNVGQAISLESGAILTVNSDGSFTYIPAAGFIGPDSFTYTASDGVNQVTANVTINVTNEAPVAIDDVYSMYHDQILTETAGNGLLSNDSDIDGDTLTITDVDTTNLNPGATLIVFADGSFEYTPAAGWVGDDIFNYTISDGVATDTATVTIHVTNGSGGSGGKIGDYVWLDEEDENGVRNGVQDAGESGLAGITVNLLDEFGGWLDSTTTDSFGYYSFSGLAAGNYRLEFVAPTDYAFTGQNLGGNYALDSDADSSGYTDVFSLAVDEHLTDLDAGLFYTGGSGGGG